MLSPAIPPAELTSDDVEAQNVFTVYFDQLDKVNQLLKQVTDPIHLNREYILAILDNNNPRVLPRSASAQTRKTALISVEAESAIIALLVSVEETQKILTRVGGDGGVSLPVEKEIIECLKAHNINTSFITTRRTIKRYVYSAAEGYAIDTEVLKDYTLRGPDWLNNSCGPDAVFEALQIIYENCRVKQKPWISELFLKSLPDIYIIFDLLATSKDRSKELERTLRPLVDQLFRPIWKVGTFSSPDTLLNWLRDFDDSGPPDGDIPIIVKEGVDARKRFAVTEIQRKCSSTQCGGRSLQSITFNSLELNVLNSGTSETGALQNMISSFLTEKTTMFETRVCSKCGSSGSIVCSVILPAVLIVTLPSGCMHDSSVELNFDSNLGEKTVDQQLKVGVEQRPFENVSGIYYNRGRAHFEVYTPPQIVDGGIRRYDGMLEKNGGTSGKLQTMFASKLGFIQHVQGTSRASVFFLVQVCLFILSCLLIYATWAGCGINGV